MTTTAAFEFVFRGRTFRSGDDLSGLPPEQLANLLRTGHAVAAPAADAAAPVPEQEPARPKRKR